MTDFSTTRWSIVLAAGKGAGDVAAAALSKLCEMYWHPLYCYVRRQGCNITEAEDLTQEFFARLLSKNYLGDLGPSQGKFRAYLLAAIKHFLSDERDRNRAGKRGGKIRVISLDAQAAELRYISEPVDGLTPEKIFEKQWALAILERAFDRLEKEFADSGKQRLFDLLKPVLTQNEDARSYREISTALNVSEGSAKMAATRMRRRYQELLKDEVAGTVSNQGDAESEFQFLISALAT